MLATTATADHPIAGVITLLEKLEVETKQEAEAEAATYQKFQYWCKRSTRMLTRAMKKEKKSIAELDDKIAGLSADIAKLDGSIEATDVAIEVMEEEEQAASNALMQTSARHLVRKAAAAEEAAKAALKKAKGPEDLLKLNPGANNPFKPKAKTFSSHEGGVIETFKGLEEGWGIDKLSEEEQETNALNAYKLAKQARDTAIKTAEDAKADKEDSKSDKESEKAQAVSDRDETQKMLEGDTATLETTDSDCKTKAAEWDERTKIRN